MSNISNRQRFLEHEFKIRNIPVISQEDKIDKNEFLQYWDKEEPEFSCEGTSEEKDLSNLPIDEPVPTKKELTPAEKKAQADARKVKESRVPDRLWRYLSPAERADRSNRFVEGYLDYVHSGTIPGVSGWKVTPEGYLLSLLGELYLPKTYSRIHNTLVYMTDDEVDVVQTAHIDAMKVMRADRQKGKIQFFESTSFEHMDLEDLKRKYLQTRDLKHAGKKTPQDVLLGYFGSIYKNKACDYLRYFDLLSDKDQDPSEKYKIRNPEHLDTPAGEEEDTAPINQIADSSSEKPYEQLLEVNSPKTVISRHYILHLLNHKNVPPAPMTVMYTRVLFQIQKLLDPDTIEDGIQKYMKNVKDSAFEKNTLIHLRNSGSEATKYGADASLKWAMKRMGSMNIDQLVDDSERTLHFFMEETEDLVWGNHFWNQLETPADPIHLEKSLAGRSMLWRDVVPTADIPESKLSHWATDVHNSIAGEVITDIAQDQELIEFIRSNYEKSGKTFQKVSHAVNKQTSKKRARKAPGKENQPC